MIFRFWISSIFYVITFLAGLLRKILKKFNLKTRFFITLEIFTFSSHTEYIKRESIVIAWVKKNSLLLMNVHVLNVLEDKTSKKISVCLYVCLSVWLAVRTWTFAVDTRVVKKTRFWGNQLLFHFLNLYVEKKTLAKAVAFTMIFNTVSTMTNLSLNSQNRLFSCSEVGLLIRFLLFHPIKISFMIPEACAIIFNTASLVNKFMKQRNKKIKNIVYIAAHAPTFFFYTYKDVLRNPRFVGWHLLVPRRS